MNFIKAFTARLSVMAAQKCQRFAPCYGVIDLLNLAIFMAGVKIY